MRYSALERYHEAYLGLLRIPHTSPLRLDPAVQSVLCKLRDTIAEQRGTTAQVIQDECEWQANRIGQP